MFCSEGSPLEPCLSDSLVWSNFNLCNLVQIHFFSGINHQYNDLLLCTRTL
uniref:Uncharacterized protein n=1 Tax=Arundo donax TaxID=35708 RepID=A0A0A9EI67_ARUDO